MDGGAKTPRPQTSRPGPVRAALIIIFILGCAMLGWRGASRALGGGSGDLAIIYTSARCWLAGENPYEAADIARQWALAGGGESPDPALLGSAVLLYPPPTFVILAPLASLPWSLAAPAWLVLSVLLYIATVAAAARIAGLARGTTAWWALLACSVWLAPVATNLMVGQLAIAAVALAVLAQRARVAAGGQSWRTGVLLSLGAALKPQIAGLFIVYEAGRLRWRNAAWAAAVLAAVAAIGIGRMEAAGVPWRSSWTRNLADFTTLSNGDPTRANPDTRHHIISLHYPLHTFTDDRSVVRILVYAIVGALCLAYFVIDLRRGRQRGEGRHELVSLSMVTVVSLMVVYHRFYDAVLLVFPLALAVSTLWSPGRRVPGAALLGLLALFALPTAAILAEAAKRGMIPAGLSGTLLWEHLILPHQALALPAMAAVLLLIRLRTPPPEALSQERP